MAMAVYNTSRLQSRNVLSAIWMEHHLVHVGYNAFDLKMEMRLYTDSTSNVHFGFYFNTSIISSYATVCDLLNARNLGGQRCEREVYHTDSAPV